MTAIDLLHAAKAGDLSRLASLVAQGADVNQHAADATAKTPLHFVAVEGHLSCVQYLVQAGATVDSVCATGNTPLFDVVDYKPFVASGSAMIAKYLLEAGANPNASVNHGLSVLHIAAKKTTPYYLEMLLSCGNNVDIDQVDSVHKWPSLHFAVAWRQRHNMNVLLAHGANVNLKTKDGQTALHLAAERSETKCCLDLLAAGADVNATDHNGQLPEDLAKNLEVKSLLRHHRQLLRAETISNALTDLLQESSGTATQSVPESRHSRKRLLSWLHA